MGQKLLAIPTKKGDDPVKYPFQITQVSCKEAKQLPVPPKEGGSLEILVPESFLSRWSFMLNTLFICALKMLHMGYVSRESCVRSWFGSLASQKEKKMLN